MPLITIYYKVELTLYKEDVHESLKHPVDLSTCDQDFQLDVVNYMNEHREMWFQNLVDTRSLVSCVIDTHFEWSDTLCFSIHVDTVENAEHVLDHVIMDENTFYDTWASCPAWGENKYTISEDLFYDIFLVPLSTSIEMDEIDDIDEKNNDVDDLIEKWIHDTYQRQADLE